MQTFELNDTEEQKAQQWWEKHKAECIRANAGSSRGAIAVSFLSYEFTPTSVHTIVHARCACGAIEDVTDCTNI